MASVNKVIIVGNLGREPEVRYMPSGDAVANLAVATTDKWKDKQTGEAREQTEWHRVSLFGKLAEIAGQYLKKGSQVYIEGSLRTRKYTDNNGVEKYATEIRGDVMQMLGSRQDGGGQQQGGYQSQQYQSQGNNRPANQGQQRQQPQGNNNQQGRKNNPGFDDLDDDIPFN